MTSKEFEYYFELEELEPIPPSRPARSCAETMPKAENREAQEKASEETHTAEVVGNEVELPPPPQKADPVAGSVDGRQAGPSCVESESVDPEVIERRARVRQLLSVHALGQYEYCPRSGILAAELGDESDCDEPPPRLDFLPNFELERIEEWLGRAIRHLCVAAFAEGCLIVVMIMAVMEANRLQFYPAFALFLGGMIWVLRLLGTIFTLAARRTAALRAECREPDPVVKGITAVNWWSLRKAGFEAVDYPSPFRHPDVPLAGSPWRVLERGSVRIPVIHSGSHKLGPRPGELYPKHVIRLAAYAILLETIEHIEVPYGLVFPVDSVNGLAVPLSRALRDEAERRLEDFSRVLSRSQGGEAEPKPPRNVGCCKTCRHGEPLPVKQKEIAQARKAGRPLLVLRQEGGACFHCVCGDRFGAAPPHDKSIKLGLTAALG